MTSTKRTTAIALTVLVVFAMLLSAFFIAFEAGHDCPGDGCSICAVISACCDFIRKLLPLAAAFFAPIAAIPALVTLPLRCCGGPCTATPAAQKIKMLN